MMSFFKLLILLLILLLFINRYRNNPRVAILLISMKTNDSRLLYEKEIWKKYMNRHPNIDCYFIECDQNEKIISNTIYSSCHESLIPGIYQKSLLSLKKIHIKNPYDFYVRGNLSTFTIFHNLLEHISSISHDKPIIAGHTWDRKDISYPSGTSILLNSPAVDLLLSHGFQDKYFKSSKSDDVVLAEVLRDQGIPSMKIDNWLYMYRYQQSPEWNIQRIKSGKYPFVRTKPKSQRIEESQPVLDNLYSAFYDFD